MTSVAVIIAILEWISAVPVLDSATMIDCIRLCQFYLLLLPSPSAKYDLRFQL